jgi:hypothetical protein
MADVKVEVKRETGDSKASIKKQPLNEGYLHIPPTVKDQFGEKFAKELYDGKKINKPIDTIDVRASLGFAHFLLPILTVATLLTLPFWCLLHLKGI